ncbi:hypothetical protein HY383_04215 [Candidatus Daviesbacteria bacterium]|nr:hypothetical protein [Candidatus Daviesbacteria bacterium]
MASLQQLERDWLLARVNPGTAQVTIDQLKRTYFNGQSFTGTLPDQTKQWLRKVITDALGTPSNTPYIGTLLIETLIALSVTPTQYINENWKLFYINYSP